GGCAHGGRHHRQRGARDQHRRRDCALLPDRRRGARRGGGRQHQRGRGYRVPRVTGDTMAFTYTSAKYEVWGRMRVTQFTGCAFNNGDTLAVGMYNVRQVTEDSPSTTTNVPYTVAAATPATEQSTITPTTLGPAVAAPFALTVIGS